MLTVERLRELLHYDPETGVFTNRVTRGKALKGMVAGGSNLRGYWAICIDFRKYPAHILAWFYTHGVWPRVQLDHRDTNGMNNRIENLREATGGQNLQNKRRAHKNNKLGILGVRLHVKGRYQARIRVSNRERSIGYFDTAAEAHAAYVKAKRELHPFSTL